jgi:hypothetical protein
VVAYVDFEGTALKSIKFRPIAVNKADQSQVDTRETRTNNLLLQRDLERLSLQQVEGITAERAGAYRSQKCPGVCEPIAPREHFSGTHTSPATSPERRCGLITRL